MRNRLTQLEILEADHQGILIAAKAGLDRGKSSHALAQSLSLHFGVSLTKSTVEKYRTKRWQFQHDELNKQKASFVEAASLVGEHGLSNAASALLFEQIRTLSPAHLLGILRVDMQNKNLKLKRKALNQITESEASMQNLTADERANMGQRAADRMRAIFGLIPLDEERDLHLQYPEGIPTQKALGCSSTLPSMSKEAPDLPGEEQARATKPRDPAADTTAQTASTGNETRK